MPERLRYHVHGHPVPQSEGGVGVPELVEVDRGDPDTIAQRLEVGCVEGLRVEIAALVRREDEAILSPRRRGESLFGLAPAVLPQDGEDLVAQVYRALRREPLGVVYLNPAG